MLPFTREGESLQANKGACPSLLLAYIIPPLGVDEEEEEEGGEKRESQIREKGMRKSVKEREIRNERGQEGTRREDEE